MKSKKDQPIQISQIRALIMNYKRQIKDLERRIKDCELWVKQKKAGLRPL